MATYLDTVETVQRLARPLLLAILLAVAVQIATTILLRDRDRGAFLGALAVLAVVHHALAWLMFLTASIPLWIGILRSRRVVPLNWPRLTLFLNTVSAITLALTLANAAVAGRIIPRQGAAAAGGVAKAPASAPDIYVLLLDGHPRADTLQRDFQLDIGPFLDSMRADGFDVADQAHSNYNMTALTIASMLNARHIAELMPDPPPKPGGQSRELVQLINGGAALTQLRSLGYVVVAIPSPFVDVAVIDADQFLDSGEVTSFEVALLRFGWLRHVLPDLQRSWLHQQERDRIRATFDRLEDLAGQDAPQPRFVFAHVMAPHPPIVFTADGSPRDGWGCFPEVCGFWDQLYDADIREPVRGQITYLDKLVLDTSRRIVETSKRPAVVIVFSDHGFRHELDDRDEMLHSLFLSYTPGRTGLFPPDTSPINIVPRILNGYLGTSLALATEESYITELRGVSTNGYFPLVPWAP